MSRLFWVALGLGAGGMIGITVMRRIERTRKALTPTSILTRAASAAGELRTALEDAYLEGRRAMHEREAELRRALGIDLAPGSYVLPPSSAGSAGGVR